MSQQFGIMIMIDVKAALKTRNIEEHVYLIDNMKDFGSENEGTKDLISKINGTYWPLTNSQAGEEVLNWLAVDINDLPRTVQKNFVYSYFRNKSIIKFIENHVTPVEKNPPKDKKGKEEEEEPTTTVGDEDQGQLLKLTNRGMEILSKAVSSERGLELEPAHTDKIKSIWPLIDPQGSTSYIGEKDAADIEENFINLPPIVTNISGEAVDLGIMYPAQYESPNFSTEGWYWCATINTSKAGTFKYKIHVTLFDLEVNPKDPKETYWKPVHMSFDSAICISRDPMKNGFTGRGNYYLPISKQIDSKL
jgi:hypothetical protein